MLPRSRLSLHQSRKFSEHKQARTYMVWILSVFVIGIFIFCLSEISYISFLNIKKVEVSGIREDLGSKIKAQVLENIDGAYLGLFSKSNALFYPKKSMVANLLSAVPQAESVSIQREGLSGLRLNINQRYPKAVICISLPDFSSNEDLSYDDDCYYADKNGLIFDKASSSTTKSYNLYYIPSLIENSTSSQSVLGLIASSSLSFQLLDNFYDSIRKVGLKPEFILIKDDGEYEIYANDTVIYFNNIRPLNEQLSNLVSFWNYPNNEKYHKGNSSDFEYIDIRYGSNVFYRLK